MEHDSAVQGLLDRQQIEDKLKLYCRAIDRLDVELLRSIYWPEGTDDHGSFVGNAHEFADFIMVDLRKRVIDGMHAIMHSVIDVQGQFATAESYYWAYQLCPGGVEAVTEFFGARYAAQHADRIDGPHDFFCGGRYIDLFEQRDGEWKVLRRKITNEWNTVRPTDRITDQGAIAHYNLPGMRGPDDWVYANRVPGKG
ncbi:nuclear transport factor 2 family protein [Novosphingobium lentum]|uniref:nuclear transport factor 2 family protein n=1 Tax=Novosphingobium lentum TaxID=145287 RepID=UPI000836CD28|nr:nuclear transport factor 2 family protein [Novosphingobium lentum]